MDSSDAARFKVKLSRALQKIETILDRQRNQRKHPDDVPHRYEDKFAMAESACRASFGSLLNFFSILGLDAKTHAQLVDWHRRGKTVTLRFKFDETCQLNRQKDRDVEKSEKVRVHKTGFFGLGARDVTETHKIITTVTDYFWDFSGSWTIVAFHGAHPHQNGDNNVELKKRNFKIECKTSSKTPEPRPVSNSGVHDLNLAWLLSHAKPSGDGYAFAIDRKDSKLCRTPRRNPDVEKALTFFDKAKIWANKVAERTLRNTELKHNHFFVKGTQYIRRLKHKTVLCRHFEANGTCPYAEKCMFAHGRNELRYRNDVFRSIAAEGGDKGGSAQVFPVVVAAITMNDPPAPSSSKAGASKSEDGDAPAAVGTLVSEKDFTAFMREHERSLLENLTNIEKTRPPTDDATCCTSRAEVGVAFACFEIVNLSDALYLTLGEIERMLHRQVVKAIGKLVTPEDFAAYMDFHYSKVFKTSFAPSPVCYAVRAGLSSPQGEFSLEKNGVPIRTATRVIESSEPKRFALNAACDVRFEGPTFVHASIMHRFSDTGPLNVQLVARARQFSSFVLLVGTVVDANRFASKAAMIVRNKDDLRIPLLLETLPTAKQFRDAIGSLSPEQQRFCKAFRSMQLGSTVFCFAVLQIRPQIEKVLNMSPGSLTKEIELTESLMTLFIEYQISPDLISCDPISEDENRSSKSEIECVRRNCRRVEAIVEAEKKKELEEAKRRAEKKRLEEQQEKERTLAELMQSMNDLRRNAVETLSSTTAFGARATSNCTDLCLDGAFVDNTEAMALEDLPIDCDSWGAESKSEIGGGGASKIADAGLPGTAGKTKRDNDTSVAPKKQEDSTATKTSDRSSSKRVKTSSDDSNIGLDVTSVPGTLAKTFDEVDDDSAVMPTIVKIDESKSWCLRRQEGLLSDPKDANLDSERQCTEKNAAFDLLDALTRSGLLSVVESSYHVVIVATHAFEKTLINTIVRDNTNPIEHVERSQIVMSSVIFQKAPSVMVEDAHTNRVEKSLSLLE